MAGGMRFALLGPLSVRRDGTAIGVPAGRQRALLAALLLNANRAVPVAGLVEILWGSEPPPSARSSRSAERRAGRGLDVLVRLRHLSGLEGALAGPPRPAPTWPPR
jgi:hypothetical protein